MSQHCEQASASCLCSCLLIKASRRRRVRSPIVGGMLIDGTGRPPVEDAVVVFSGGRIQEVGKRGEVTIPRGAQVIDAKGKTILPGLIDGHCHYWEWLGELYLAYGVTTCPDINNSPTEWIIAQKDGIQKGKIRGPRLWISGHALDGPRPQGMPEQRWQRGSIIVRTDEEARRRCAIMSRRAWTVSKFSNGCHRRSPRRSSTRRARWAGR